MKVDSRPVSKARTKRNLLVILSVTCAVAFASCIVPPPNAKDIVPSVGQIGMSANAGAGTKTVRVAGKALAGAAISCSGSCAGATDKPGWWVTNSVFQKALAKTVAESGLFKSVSSNGPADYELRGSLFMQQLNVQQNFFDPRSFNVIIGVNYKLIRELSGKQVWSDNLFSQCGNNSKEAVAMAEKVTPGPITVMTAPPINECAMRKNFSQMIRDISKLPL